MIVGTLSIKLLIRDARNLKDKRRVLRSLKDNIRNRHNVSVAEVGAQHSRQQALLGVAMVANDSRYVDAALAKIVDLVRGFRLVQLVDYEVEIY
ncbi:MAG: DUF503 domain-containing protein [Candidatus Brocadiia bacterium]